MLTVRRLNRLITSKTKSKGNKWATHQLIWGGYITKTYDVWSHASRSKPSTFGDILISSMIRSLRKLPRNVTWLRYNILEVLILGRPWICWKKARFCANSVIKRVLWLITTLLATTDGTNLIDNSFSTGKLRTALQYLEKAMILE